MKWILAPAASTQNGGTGSKAAAVGAPGKCTDTLVTIQGTCTTQPRKKEQDKIIKLSDWWAPETIAQVKVLK